ncbi:MAG: fumarylacetoacetate hydrolase family protein [Aigarchaeota archaeon]|nr:fumarylacetoacetate hydrolase family protein [Candidatus Pelearchaeum maunauluense]
MKLATITIHGSIKVGALTEYGILDLSKAYTEIIGGDTVPGYLLSVKEILCKGDEAYNTIMKLIMEAPKMNDQRALYCSYEEVGFKAPIPDPQKILCVAANYYSHTRELRSEVPEAPYFFGKYNNALIGHGENIIIPKSSTKVDYEVELAVVIGKRGKYISSNDVDEYIAGYMVFNDVSFRDKQFPPGWPEKKSSYGMNWILGKSLDSAAPCGPYLVTKDEIGSPYPLKLTLRVNGEVRQEGNTEEMIFKIGQLVEYVSDGMTLEPGDIIATGTPAGVAAAGKPYLKHGDIVEAEIEKIGLLRNTVIKEMIR